jgi:hypothetical protein
MIYMYCNDYEESESQLYPSTTHVAYRIIKTDKDSFLGKYEAMLSLPDRASSSETSKDHGTDLQRMLLPSS